MSLWKRHSMQKRIDMLRDMESFLNSLLIHIEFSMESLPEMLKSDRHNFPQRVSEYLDGGLSLQKAWSAASDEFADDGDKAFVADILEDFGRAGPKEEKEKAERNLRLCRERIVSAKENIGTKGRSEAVLPIYISVIAALVLL